MGEQATIIFSYLDNHSLACATQLLSIQIFCAILLLYVTLRTVIMVGRGCSLHYYIESLFAKFFKIVASSFSFVLSKE